MATDEVNGDWAVAAFPVYCDSHMGQISPGTPYRLDRAPGRLRRVCRECAVTAAPKLADLAVSDGHSQCGWCGTAPPAGEPWATVHVGTTISRACLECWTRWDQKLPLRREDDEP